MPPPAAARECDGYFTFQPAKKRSSADAELDGRAKRHTRLCPSSIGLARYALDACLSWSRSYPLKWKPDRRMASSNADDGTFSKATSASSRVRLVQAPVINFSRNRSCCAKPCAEESESRVSSSSSACLRPHAGVALARAVSPASWSSAAAATWSGSVGARLLRCEPIVSGCLLWLFLDNGNELLSPQDGMPVVTAQLASHCRS